MQHLSAKDDFTHWSKWSLHYPLSVIVPDFILILLRRVSRSDHFFSCCCYTITTTATTTTTIIWDSRHSTRSRYLLYQTTGAYISARSGRQHQFCVIHWNERNHEGILCLVSIENWCIWELMDIFSYFHENGCNQFI